MDAQNKTVAEFFAGIGLIRIGLENAGWRTEGIAMCCEAQGRYDLN
jgi:site-specific DNA-cytosine methylase